MQARGTEGFYSAVIRALSGTPRSVEIWERVIALVAGKKTRKEDMPMIHPLAEMRAPSFFERL
jgi:hypothetical protein